MQIPELLDDFRFDSDAKFSSGQCTETLETEAGESVPAASFGAGRVTSGHQRGGATIANAQSGGFAACTRRLRFESPARPAPSYYDFTLILHGIWRTGSG